MKNGPPRGQSMQEYAIVLGLAIIVATGALSGLGGEISSLLGGLFGGGANVGAGGARNTGGVNKLLGLVAPPKTSLTNSTSGKASSLSITPESGRLTSVGGPTDSSTSAQDGKTTALAYRMEAVAADLLDSGSIDTKQYNALIALANQGHRIALIQKTLGEAFNAAGGDHTIYNNTPITFEGKTYLPSELSKSLDGRGDDLLKGDITPFPNDPIWGLEIVQLRALYQQALGMGSLDDPKALSMINDLGNQIVSLSDQFEGAVEYGFLSEYMDAPRETNQDSVEICDTGNGQDSGTHCSG